VADRGIEALREGMEEVVVAEVVVLDVAMVVEVIAALTVPVIPVVIAVVVVVVVVAVMESLVIIELLFITFESFSPFFFANTSLSACFIKKSSFFFRTAVKYALAFGWFGSNLTTSSKHSRDSSNLCKLAKAAPLATRASGFKGSISKAMA